MTDTATTPRLTDQDWNARAPIWTGPVRCRHCGQDKLAEAIVTWQGFVFISVRVRWGKEADGTRTRWSGFAPADTFQGQDGGPFTWRHDRCGRDDGPADIGKLTRDALNVKLQRRGYLIA